jgi:hypothetical protein
MKCARPGCTNELIGEQLRRDGQRYCSRECVGIDSRSDRAERAALLGVHVTTHCEAERERRLVAIGGTERIYARRRCANCEQARNLRGACKLCTVCMASGLRWCGRKKHVVTVADHVQHLGVCKACRIAYDAATKAARTPQPPTGYIRLEVVARRIGYSMSTLNRHIGLGWMAEHLWRRGPRSPWWIEDRATYPKWSE